MNAHDEARLLPLWPRATTSRLGATRAREADAGGSLKHYVEITQIAERALFDFVFNADSNSTFGPDDPSKSGSATAVAMRLEPLTLLGALSAVTEPDRADLDRDHDLSRSVPCGADVRDARPA